MQYDKNRFKIHALPHPFVLLWVLFPGIMFFELISGQRLPKVALVDKEMERSYVPCPHCETLNDRRLWAACGHWFGLVCPSCHQIIPCLWNIFSLIILAITYPLWYFPVRFFRHRWIAKEKEKLAKVLERPLIQAKSINSPLIFLANAFASGGFMWVMWVVLTVLREGREWDLKMMFESLPICMVVGFGIGVYMRWMEKDNEKKKERSSNVPERPLIRSIRAKSINWFELRWFVRGTFYFGGFLWVTLAVQPVLKGRESDLMFDMLPVCLLLGFIWGALVQVLTNSLNLLDERKRKKGRKT
ncbi:hypothetical protein J5I95_15360, partial [Candidatus Poribacteria bacterium]|nr:hypothetical protein [Candidatus Poribacteria bacterium]